MSKIIINKSLTIEKNITGIKTVNFDYIGNKVYSATKLQNITAIFISNLITPSSNFISWDSIDIDYVKPTGTNISIYIKSSLTEEDIDTIGWSGPYLNQSSDISSIKNNYFKFMIVLRGNESSFPVVNGLYLKYVSSQDSTKFFTKTFNLGFAPKHILLTHRADVSDDSVLRFAVSGFDSIDPDDYQYIEPNQIEELKDISILSEKIKVMVEMIGNNKVPIVLHEFSLMFSGDQQARVNEESTSSISSLSSSSSSSYIENWSSSSKSSSSSSYVENWSSSSTESSSSSYIENWSSSSTLSSSSSYIENWSSSSGSISSSSSSSYVENWSSSSKTSWSSVSSRSSSSSTSSSSSSSYIKNWSSSSKSSSSSSYINNWSSSSMSSSSSSYIEEWSSSSKSSSSSTSSSSYIENWSSSSKSSSSSSSYIEQWSSSSNSSSSSSSSYIEQWSSSSTESSSSSYLENWSSSSDSSSP